MEFIENEKIVSYPCDNEHYLDHGEEADVYHINDSVIKVFKSSASVTTRHRIDENFCNKFSMINSKRILLPTSSLYSITTKEFNAYKMDYVENFGIDNFFLLSREDLAQEMKLLKEDIGLLSDNSILINDLDTLKNVSFHDGLYLIDPGSYMLDKNNEKGKIRSYAKNKEQINNLLLDLLEKKANKICSDDEKVKVMMRNLKKEIYQDGRDILEYFSAGIETDNLKMLIEKKLEQLECNMKIDGRKVNLKRDYRRIFFDSKKEIYYSKKDGKKLYLYKTEKSELKLSKEEIQRLSKLSTERIITPEDFVETSKKECKAFQVTSKYECPDSIMDLDGNAASREFELLKKDAIALAREGIYIGTMKQEDTLYSDGHLYVQCLENLESKDTEHLEQDNIESLNGLLREIIGSKLYEITTVRNYCYVMTSLKNESGVCYLGDTIKKELEESKNLESCVKTMVKTRGK